VKIKWDDRKKAGSLHPLATLALEPAAASTAPTSPARVAFGLFPTTGVACRLFAMLLELIFVNGAEHAQRTPAELTKGETKQGNEIYSWTRTSFR